MFVRLIDCLIDFFSRIFRIASKFHRGRGTIGIEERVAVTPVIIESERTDTPVILESEWTLGSSKITSGHPIKDRMVNPAR